MALEAQEVAVRLRLLDGARFNSEVDAAKAKIAGIGDAGAAANAKAAEAAGAGGFLAGAHKSADVMSGKLDKLSKKSLQFARQTAALSIGAGGLLFEGAKSYLSFAGKALELQTQAFASGKEREALEKASFGFSKFGYSATQAMEALYPIQSVMHNVTKDTELLTAAMEGAAIGHTNLAETADVLTSSLAARPIGVSGAREQMNLLHQTVGAGKMHLSTLNEIIQHSRIESAAAAQGIYERGLLGAIAGVSTTVGEQGAPSFASVFRTLISKLTFMKGGAGEAAKRLGFGPSSLYDIAKGGNWGLVNLARALRNTEGKVGQDQWVRDINEMFGGARSASTLLTLIRALPHVEYATGKLTNNQGDKQWEHWYKLTQEKDPNFQMNVFKAKMQNSLIEFGKAEWPTIIKFLKDLAKILEVVVNAFNGMPGPLKTALIYTMAFAALMAPGAFLFSGLAALGGKLFQFGGWLLGVGGAARESRSMLSMFGTSVPRMLGHLGLFIGKIGLVGAALYGLAEVMHRLFGTPTAGDLLHKAFGQDATSKNDIARREYTVQRNARNASAKAVQEQLDYLRTHPGFLQHLTGSTAALQKREVEVNLHIDGKQFAHAVSRPMTEEVNRVNRGHETHR